MHEEIGHKEIEKDREVSMADYEVAGDPVPAPPPTSVGVINDVVGYIPASPYNPEIFYTPDGEEVAAATLLTLRLMPASIVRQLLVGHARIICAHTYDEQSEQIYFNLDRNEPLGKIQPAVVLISEKDRKEYEMTLGLASVIGGVIQIFETSTKKAKQVQKIKTSAFLSLFQSLQEEDDGLLKNMDIDIEPSEIPDYEDIFIGLPQLQTKKAFPLSAVLSEWESLEGCKELIDHLPDHLSHVPMTLAHEMSHLAGIQKDALLRGAKEILPTLQPDCEQKFNEAVADMKLPSAFMEYPPFRETQLCKYANKVFQEEVAIPECLAAMCNLHHLKNYEYFLADQEEAAAELSACAIIGDMNHVHGTNIPQSGLQAILPESFNYVANWIGTMPEVGLEELEAAQSDFCCPDQQLLPRDQWLELCEKNLELD